MTIQPGATAAWPRPRVFLSATASRQELLVDDGDRHSTGMIGFDRVRQLEQFLLRDLGVGERAILLEFHRACLVSAAVMCGTWITVLSRRWLSKTSPHRHLMSELRF